MRLLDRCKRLIRRVSEASGFRPQVSNAYQGWIRHRVAERRQQFALPRRATLPQIDILTLVFDTDQAVLQQTALSVLQQDYPAFRWVIWDNGSTEPGTLAVLRRLKVRSKVEVHHSQRNLGITAGHFQALKCCRGDYVALLDHDDQLYPDALRVAAWHILRQDRPALLFSDEDKLDDAGSLCCPFFKPSWNPALLQSTGYTCHLTLFRRDLAARLGVFSNPSVEGAQDWDLALRFLDAGHEGVHIPEVLYSWRIHAGSTAGKGHLAKSYVLAGQQACLEASLVRRGLLGRYQVIPNPIYPFVDGHWHVQARSAESLSIPVTYHWRSLPRVTRMTGIQDACALLDLNPSAGLVGGRVLEEDGSVLAAPELLYMDGRPVPGLTGLPGDDVGYFGLSLSPQDVRVVENVPWLARRQALDQVGYHEGMEDRELSRRLRKNGWRLLFCPQLSGGESRQHETHGLQGSVERIQDQPQFFQRHSS